MKKQTKHIHTRVEEDTYETLLRLAQKKGFDDTAKTGISRVVRLAIRDFIRRELEKEYVEKQNAIMEEIIK